MNLPTPEDLERMTDDELRSFADDAHALEVEGRILLSQRLAKRRTDSSVLASRPAVLRRMVKVLEPRDSRRTFSPLMLAVGVLVVLMISAPGLVRFASKFKALVDQAQQQLESQSK